VIKESGLSLKFGEKLRKIRTSRNLTLDQLADAVGSSKAYIWQLENKKQAKLSAELLLKIATELRVAPEFLLDDTRDEPSSEQLNEAFFRKFRSLSENDRRTIERLVAGLDVDK
jgi:transcriptional regulator with XRE-family HTH domain